MTVVRPSLPDLGELTLGLRAILEIQDGPCHELKVLSRERLVNESTFPIEVVTCEFEPGNIRSIVCKYSAPLKNNSYGHRGGVEYESLVYHQALSDFDGTLPKFYGVCRTSAQGVNWMVMEHLKNAVWVDTDSALVQAAAWLGRFHAQMEKKLQEAPLAFLKQYDREYYMRWARRTAEFGAPLSRRFNWLARLCQGFEELTLRLLPATRTLIHGEFYPMNVLLKDKKTYPVDWESAAVAPGEIDLASLTEGWSEETKAACEREYRANRWRAESDGEFLPRLQAARIYWHLRWLGDRPEWTNQKKSFWHFDELQTLGRDSGII